MNFLEQLAAEWYQYQGYFVRTNIKFGRRARGGYEGEMDVVAYDPNTLEIIHLETSTDSSSNEERKNRFQKKFENAHSRYLEIFPFKGAFKQIAVVGFNMSTPSLDLGERVEVLSIPQFIQKITLELKKKNPAKSAVPETYPLLRAIQYAAFYTH